MKVGIFADGMPGFIRVSSAMLRLDAEGKVQLKEELSKINSTCPKHGKLTDPILGHSEGRLVLGCPWCSGPEIQKLWEDEGKLS